MAASICSGAQWPLLSDLERTVQQALVLKPQLVIHSIYNGYWLWGRPSVENLRQDLRAATRKIGPDWDPSALGLREAGHRQSFTVPWLEQVESGTTRCRA